ncbi:MAG: xanthine dehydrogenase family protein molybdopterin-binding subunit [Hyphomicrobiales bacterium]|nr:xanthine dehydrogenase family protein molybdopterin-binding subunit [Hyphomicrobiales bacterium]MCP5374276.1 xanthine dehydrogenase family protein molybdopterin-binding subunit [Hyphomicrobiales bacterium]
MDTAFLAGPRPAAGLDVSRRGFLLGAAAAAGGGLLVGFRRAEAAESGATDAAPVNPLEAYVHVRPDGGVTVLSAHFDMGQGSYHGLATLVVEELGADWTKVDVVGATGNTRAYGNLAWGGTAQGTGGSSTMVSSWRRYRTAGAAARMMLVAAAARAWNVPAAEITVDRGVLRHGADRRAGFGDMAAAAAALPVPAEVPLKAPGDWTQIGNGDLKRFDRAGKTTGRQDFTIDVRLPGMLTAVPVHPPRFGAKVKSFDAAPAKAVKGVVDVVETPRGLAVVADHTWAAMRGREALFVQWDETGAETRGSDEILADYTRRAAGAPDAWARQDGDLDGALAGAAKVVEATYTFPYLAHAAMEPLNAVARRAEDGVIEVWGGLQNTDTYHQAAARTAGVDPSRVRMHMMKSGGGFGRRGSPDSDVIIEAVAAAKALAWRAPVKMQWTREDDMAGGRYRPAYVHHMKAGLDADGNLVAWYDHIVGQSILRDVGFPLPDGAIDQISVEGSSTLPYAVPNLSVGLTTTQVGVPVLWWRSVGSTHTGYATEAFFDEVAEAAGRDPVAFRLSLLAEHPRHAAVLRAVAEMADWGGPVPAGRHRGVALHESFRSVVAQVAEVSVEGGTVRVHRVWCAVDCGVAVNPDVVKAQMEGAIGFGLGAVMGEELTLTGGVVDQTNYDGYTPLRIDAMPQVEVRILPSANAPTGVGEPGVPPLGPAVANAVHRATGKRLRRLPFARELG